MASGEDRLSLRVGTFSVPCVFSHSGPLVCHSRRPHSTLVLMMRMLNDVFDPGTGFFLLSYGHLCTFSLLDIFDVVEEM